MKLPLLCAVAAATSAVPRCICPSVRRPGRPTVFLNHFETSFVKIVV